MSDYNGPAAWEVDDVVTWATRSGLAAATIQALAQNKVDGPTLVTLNKTELQSELGIVSLPARRYLWDLIKDLRDEQDAKDYTAAIQAHEQEIRVFATTNQGSNMPNGGPDAASGGLSDANSSFGTVVGELVSDAQRQRQIIEDHLMAHQMQRTMKCGQQVYEDAEAARREQERLNQLLNQAESDRVYAESLATGRERAAVNARKQHNVDSTNANIGNNATAAARRVSSLFGLAIGSCAENKINVAEAFASGKVKPVLISQENDDEDEVKEKAAARKIPLEGLPFLNQCNVCYEENLRGFTLACGHSQCVRCTKQLFKTALRDNSLLPLRCCEVPIDMNISFYLLKRDQASLLLQRVEEIEARNKMYCPCCSTFLNLDLVDSSSATDLICDCGTAVCTVCKTSAHSGLTCAENQGAKTGSEDDLLFDLANNKDWKQCPKCSMMIELRSGCNHMTCAYCRHEFCYNCLRGWNSKTGQCTSGRCELWEEDRLLEAGEARVQQEERARGRVLPQGARRERLRHAVAGLRANEICDHHWVRSNGYKGECPNCGFEMYAYGMRCRSDCGSTVCYTCAHHRIPRRGWR